jgi:regulatory protein
LLRKKLAGLKQDDPYKKKAALVRFAASRGFGFSEIEKVLGKLKF